MNNIHVVNTAWRLKSKFLRIYNENLQKQVPFSFSNGGAPSAPVLDPPFMFVDMFSECDGGTYGADCRYHCGHCLDKQLCDAIDGSCLNGCSSGYLGAKCTESNYDLRK